MLHQTREAAEAGQRERLADGMAKAGFYQQAIEQWRRIQKLRPDSATRLAPKLVHAHANLGASYNRQGNLPAAQEHYEHALGIDPIDLAGRNKLAYVFERLGQRAVAAKHFRQVLAFEPGHAVAYLGLATLFQRDADTERAVYYYRHALKSNPDLIGAANNLAWMLATSSDPTWRNGQEAVKLAEHAVKLTGKDHPSVLDTLAAAYAEARRFDDAIATIHRALKSVDAGSSTAQSLRTRLKQYQNRMPFRQSP